MIESLGLELSPNKNFDAYYGLIDFEFWARKNIGDEAVEYLKKNIHRWTWHSNWRRITG